MSKIYDIGVNDVNYSVVVSGIGLVKGVTKNKILWKCPYYVKWHSMLTRCYSENWHKKYPTYKGCTVSEDWWTLSNFISWVDTQPNRNWEGLHLDKDILFEGNKVYSPETCVFISREVNVFINENTKRRGESLIGVSTFKDNRIKMFSSQCRDPFKRYNHHLGQYDTELEAHKVWKERKHLYACELAEIEEDERVKLILKNKYI